MPTRITQTADTVALINSRFERAKKPSSEGKSLVTKRELQQAVKAGREDDRRLDALEKRAIASNWAALESEDGIQATAAAQREYARIARKYKLPTIDGTLSVPVGSYQVLSGKIENRSLFGIGGEAPPSGSYLVLDQPIQVNGKRVTEVFISGPDFQEGERVTLNGRIDVRSFGGVEVREGRYVALSGVSNVGAGEPRFDGRNFLDPEGRQLQVLSYLNPMIADVPSTIIALGDGKAFVGRMGGFIPPDVNPFHGFYGTAKIASPTRADRAAVKFVDDEPVSAATGEKLVQISREESEQPPYPDMMTTTWYLDPAKKTAYAFANGGIAGFRNHLTSVIRLP